MPGRSSPVSAYPADADAMKGARPWDRYRPSHTRRASAISLEIRASLPSIAPPAGRAKIEISADTRSALDDEGNQGAHLRAIGPILVAEDFRPPPLFHT